MLFGFNYISVYWAEQYVTSGLVAVVFSLITFMNPIGMRLFFGTPMEARTFFAATLGVIGVALLFLPELEQASHGGNAMYGVAFADQPIENFRKWAALRIDALNHALRGLPEEKIRYHICWGKL